MTRIAIMQPYFMPYIGYFQLISSVDRFILYDNVQYTKGWINRNRILVDGKDLLFTVPLKKGSQKDKINEKKIWLEDWSIEREKLLKKIRYNYSKALNFNYAFPLIEGCILYDTDDLTQLVENSIYKICEYFELKTNLSLSSQINIDHSKKGQDKLIEICKNQDADQYINSIGGVDLYSKEHFHSKGIELKFLKSKPIIYSQYENNFMPNLSIIDVLMFNTKSSVQQILVSYELLY